MATRPPARSGEASKRLTAAVLEVYGAKCWLQLPGCTMRATTKDHVTPVQQGGTDAMENLRPACHSCNSTRRDMSIGGTPGGILATFYLGPSLLVSDDAAATQAGNTDVLLSPTQLLHAITPTAPEPSALARTVAQRAFTSAMHQALRLREPIHLRIVHPVPTVKQLQTWARMRYFIEVTDPGREESERTAQRQGRAEQIEVARWYDRYPEGAASIERAAAHRPIATVPRNSNEPSPAVEPSRAW